MMQTEREYAEALFALALEGDECDGYLEALLTIRDIVHENPLYIELLASPAITAEERCALIDEAFASFPVHIPSFLKILCDNSRIRSLCDCIDEFEKLALAAKKREACTVYSVIELDESQKERLIKKLEKTLGKGVDATYKVDASLIGGIRIELEDKTFDGSVKHHLTEVKDVIIG